MARVEVGLERGEVRVFGWEDLVRVLAGACE